MTITARPLRQTDRRRLLAHLARRLEPTVDVRDGLLDALDLLRPFIAAERT